MKINVYSFYTFLKRIATILLIKRSPYSARFLYVFRHINEVHKMKPSALYCLYAGFDNFFKCDKL